MKYRFEASRHRINKKSNILLLVVCVVALVLIGRIAYYSIYKYDEYIGSSTSEDYHFYRQDNNGRWSHKPGRNGKVTDLDGSYSKIYDPETCRRVTRPGSSVSQNYNVFVGFFAVSPIN